jgi:hypothetical protein
MMNLYNASNACTNLNPKKAPKIKRKTKSNVSGRQQGILAWERDNNKAMFDTQNVVFGGEGWPPSFRTLVVEMREFLFNETGLKQDWYVEVANMLGKYFYQKYKIPVRDIYFGLEFVTIKI